MRTLVDELRMVLGHAGVDNWLPTGDSVRWNIVLGDITFRFKLEFIQDKSCKGRYSALKLTVFVGKAVLDSELMNLQSLVHAQLYNEHGKLVWQEVSSQGVVVYTEGLPATSYCTLGYHVNNLIVSITG